MAEVVQLSADDAERHLGGLAAVLLDCVEGGASVSFMANMTHSEAEDFWRATMADVKAGSQHLFAAFVGERLVGTVLLQPTRKPNQPHRAEVAKLLVHRAARRGGTAWRLMDALEERARALGFTLLTLDTETGSGAEPFYAGRGYVRVGDIPGYALSPDGRLCGTTFYYKRL